MPASASSSEQRRVIVAYVDEQAREAIDDRGTDAFEEVRNRALVTVLAYTGVADRKCWPIAVTTGATASGGTASTSRKA